MRILVPALLALSVLAVPSGAAQECLFGYNPDALYNVCYDASTEWRSIDGPAPTTTEGACVVGNLCPGLTTAHYGDYSHPVLVVEVTHNPCANDPYCDTEPQTHRVDTGDTYHPS